MTKLFATKLCATTALIAVLTAGMSGLANAENVPAAVSIPGTGVTVNAPVPSTSAAPVGDHAVGSVSDNLKSVKDHITNQEKRIDDGVKNGTLTAGQAAHDLKTDTKVTKEIGKLDALNAGSVSKTEIGKLNQKLDANGKIIDAQEAKIKDVVAPTPSMPTGMSK